MAHTLYRRAAHTFHNLALPGIALAPYLFGRCLSLSSITFTQASTELNLPPPPLPVGSSLFPVAVNVRLTSSARE